MSKSIAVLLFLMIAVAGVAQASSPQQQPDAKVGQRPAIADDSQRRKADLRSALRAQKQPVLDSKQPNGGTTPAGRLLSDQERADLRQQIRQQRP